MTDDTTSLQPHPRILQRRLVVALHAARGTCLDQMQALHDSLVVLARNGFTEAPAFQAVLAAHRTDLLALDADHPDAAPEIMEHVAAICRTMHAALAVLRQFVADHPQADHFRADPAGIDAAITPPGHPGPPPPRPA